MSGQIPVTVEFAQMVLSQATALCKSDEYELADVQNLRRQLIGSWMQFEADQTGHLIFHTNQAPLSGNVMERSLSHACQTALADFYFESAQRLLDTRSRFADCPVYVVHQETSVPRLYQLVVRRIVQSGYRAEIADLELALDGTGLQFIALQLAGEDWPVLVVGEDRAPVVGAPREGDMTVSPEVLWRMKEEAQRIGRASNATIEESDPVVAMAGVMSELAQLLPYRISNEIPPASGGTGAAGAN